MTTTQDPALPHAAAHRSDDPSPDAMIATRGVRRSFGATTVLTGVDLDVPRGSVAALLGPNGAGKTTMINILSTLLLPDEGVALVNGHDVVADPGAVKRSISLTGQHAAVDDAQTGYENLVMLGRLNHLGRRRSRVRAAELLERFDLVDAARTRVGTYSGGMRRRLDVAMGLVADPPVIFLDEPTTGLDPQARQTMWSVVDELVSGGTTVLLTTQYLDEADRLADHIAVLSGGRIVAEGTAADLKRRIPGEQVALGFAEPSELDAAVVALASPTAVVDRERRRLQVSTNGSPAAVKDLLDRLDAVHIPVASLALHPPSLDDVFFLLTGRPGTPTPTAAATEGADA